MNERVDIKGRVTAVLYEADGSVAEVHETENLVTTAGRQHYMDAISDSIGGGGTPSTTFSKMALGTTTGGPAAPASGSRLGNIGVEDSEGLASLTATYPKVADADSDNTGSGAYILTFACEWAAGVYTHTDITDVAVTTSDAVWNGDYACLMHAEFGSTINKTAGQTLKVFVNHTLTTS